VSGLFGILETATRGALVSQQGIAVTGHNISNVNNPDYSRQRQVLEAERPMIRQEGALGLGVRQLTIERITDDFLLRALVEENTSKGSVDVQADALAQIEEIWNEQSGRGLTEALSDFYNGFEELAASTDPTGATERELVLSRSQALVDQVHRMDAQLRDQQHAADRTIQGVLDEINAISQRIFDLNKEIVATEVQTPANDLRDARDAALRDLARLVDVQSFEQAEGDIVVMMRSNGLPLVEGESARRLVGRADPSNPFDPTFSNVHFDDGSSFLDVTADIGGGELGGVLAVRDQILPGAIRALDTIAYNLVQTVNVQHQAGFDLSGAAGGDFFTNIVPGGVADAARNLSLDGALDADGVAAAGAAPGDPGDRRNAQALSDLRSVAQALYLPGDPAPPGAATGPARSLLAHTAATVADVGQQSLTLNEARAQQDRVLETLENRRDAVSGVSLDEEVVSLVRLQAAFQANARVIASVQQMLDELVSLL